MFKISLNRKGELFAGKFFAITDLDFLCCGVGHGRVLRRRGRCAHD